MPSTYTPSTEDAAGTGRAFYQDVEISPATLADGSLKARMDTHLYPQLGDVADSIVGKTAVALVLSPGTPAAHASTVLTATVTGVEGTIPQGTIQFKDGASNIGGTHALVSGVATATVAGGFSAGAHTFTAVYVSSDNKNPSKTSAGVTVTVGADTTAPGPVTGLGHTALAATTLTLNWTNPADLDYAGAVVRYAAGAVAPADHTSGTNVADVAAPAVTVDVTGLTTATQYTFAVFAHDGSGNYAAAATHTVVTS